MRSMPFQPKEGDVYLEEMEVKGERIPVVHIFTQGHWIGYRGEYGKSITIFGTRYEIPEKIPPNTGETP